MVLTDNKTSFDNLSRFLKDNKADFEVTEADGVWTLTISGTSGEVVKTNGRRLLHSGHPAF